LAVIFILVLVVVVVGELRVDLKTRRESGFLFAECGLEIQSRFKKVRFTALALGNVSVSSPFMWRFFRRKSRVLNSRRCSVMLYAKTRVNQETPTPPGILSKSPENSHGAA